MEQILKKIKQYNTIIIHRHTNPDLDALGSQTGLAKVLKDSFPNKQIYMVGDTNNLNFLASMDEIDDSVFADALSIIVDVAVSKLVSDSRYTLAKEVIVIDHHTNPSDISGLIKIDSSYGAAAEYISDMILSTDLTISSEAATSLYGGIVTDTGRFQYSSTTSRTFLIASKLLEKGADIQFIYSNLYVEDLASKQTKAYFASNFKLTKNNVAYLMNDETIYEKFNLKPFSISRGMVNQMAGIREVPIWANFTYDPVNKNIMCEFRSRDITIVDIAKKYGGGGHACACGATVENFEIAKMILDDFDLLLEQGEKQ